MTKGYLALVAILSLHAAAAAAQTGTGTIAGTVYGQLYDTTATVGIPDVLVEVIGTGRAVSTQRDGTFRVIGVPAGRQTVSFQAVGFGPAVLPVDVATARTVDLEVTLESSPYTCDDPGGEEDTRWRDIYFQDLDAVTNAYGLTPLREETPVAGRRELRLWVVPPFGGTTLTRIVQSGGDRVGEVVATDAWYDRPPADSLTLHYRNAHHARLRETCGGLREGQAEFTYRDGTFVISAVACRARFRTAEPDWPALLEALEAAGVWTLPDQTTLPGDACTVSVDGVTLVVEALDEVSYRTYHYNEPHSHSDSPEQRARTILEMLHEMLRGVAWAH